MRRLAGWVTLLAVALVLGGRCAWASDLDPGQAKTLATLVGYVKQVETNLKLAQDGAGPGDGAVPDAKARLAKTRLAQPKALVPQVREELAKLPSDNAEVATLSARLDAAAKGIAALEARLGAAPQAAPGAPGTKLDWKQEKELKDADAYAREVAGLAEALEALAKEVDAAADKDAFDHRRLRSGAATIEKARQRAGLVKARLDALPAEGAGVKAVADALSAGLATVDRAEARLKPVHARVELLVDPARYPELATDMSRLQDLARMFAEPVNLFAGRPKRAVDVLGEARAADAEHARVLAAYKSLLVQQTAEGERLAGVSRLYVENRRAFAAAATAAHGSLPQRLDAGFGEVAKMAETAVAEAKPAFFTHGIPDRVRELEGWIALQAALDPSAAVATHRRLDALRADLATRQVSLRQAIIDANEVPPDAYRGADRAALEAAAKAAWEKIQPGAATLGVCIRATAFEREVLWRKQNATWYLIDRSFLQALVLVKQDDTLVAIRPVNLWIDHLKGDAITALPLHTAPEAPEAQSLLLLSKLR